MSGERVADGRVVEERSRDELARSRRRRLLEEGVADAVRPPPVLLSVHDHRVEHGAAIVDDDVALHIDDPGFSVDDDRGDVGPGAEGDGRGREVVIDREPGSIPSGRSPA